MVIYGYARLVAYTPDFEIAPDIAESVDVEEDRVFTFHLRPGHSWSDGEPFTSEDFRFYWEDVANDAEMSRFGPPQGAAGGRRETVVEFPDAADGPSTPGRSRTPSSCRRSPRAQPVEIFRPSHYLKKFHAKYAGLETVTKMAEEEGEQNWVALLYSKDRSYRNDNLDYPTPAALGAEDAAAFRPLHLRAQPLLLPRRRGGACSSPISTRWRSRSPSSDLIPAKVAAGEADLQGAYLSFSNFTFLKEAEERQRLRGPPLARHQRRARRALPRPQHERPGVARALPQRGFPPRAVDRDRPRGHQQHHLLRASPRRPTIRCCRNRRSSRTTYPAPSGRNTTRTSPTSCSTVSG